ncbi:MAG: hypothetical protein ACREJC_03435 [Tepidisphaeraceae bacterium]
MSKPATKENIEVALDAARNAEGSTLLVLVSPRQAHQLYLAIKIADTLAANDPESINEFAALMSVYKTLKRETQS